MTIASEKVKNASERFMLIRMEPARYIEPVSQGGGVYEESAFPYVVSRVQRNGVDLTKVTTLAGNDQYTWDESTGDVQLKLALPPDVDTNVIVVFYYLFYTGTVNRAIWQDPTDDTTTLREWKARIENYPTFYQSFNNVENGVMTIAESSIKLLNPDRELQLSLTDDDSFCNKRVEIWSVINEIENIQKIYDGTITDLSFSDINATISIVDKFNRLKQTAYMGDTESECVFTRESGSFPTMQPSASGRPCPYIVSDKSAYKTSAFDVEPGVRLPIIVEGTKAVCTDFSDNKVVTENRVWGLCRTLNVIRTQPNITGVITSVVQQGTSGIYRLNLPAASRDFYVGDTFKFNQTATDYYAIITAVASTYIQVATIKGSAIAPLVGLTHTPMPCISVTINGLPYDSSAFYIGTSAVPLYGQDYTVASSATSGGNDYHEITFVDNFENNFNIAFGNPFGPTVFVLDPDIHEVHFRIVTTVQTIGRELGRIVSKAGIDTDNTFNTIEDLALLTMRPAFHIPNIDESTYDSYLKYVEDILATTMCYLKVNINGEASVAPLTLPSSTDTRDSSLLLNGSVSVKVDYNDIVTDLVAYNPHLDSGDENAAAYTTRSKNKARYLHEVNNRDRFKHCAEFLTDRIEDYLALKSERKARYIYEVATEDIDTELGDDVLLSNKIVLGVSESRSLKVTGIDKSSDKIRIEASDLLNIPDVEA